MFDVRERAGTLPMPNAGPASLHGMRTVYGDPMTAEETEKAASLDCEGKIRRFQFVYTDQETKQSVSATGYAICGIRDGKLVFVDGLINAQGDDLRASLADACLEARDWLDEGKPERAMARLCKRHRKLEGIVPGFGLVKSPADAVGRIVQEILGRDKR